METVKKQQGYEGQKTLKILIVDDDEDVISIYEELLDDAQSYEVQTANSVEEALITAQHFSPDVLFSDLNMPGQDGFQLYKQLKSLYPDLYAILMTGYSNVDVAVKAIKIGLNDFLQKPVSEPSIYSALSKAKAYMSYLESVQVAQKEFTQSQKMISLSNMVQGIAHEINNPLAAIKGFSELIKSCRADQTEDIKRYSSIICQNVVRIEDIMSQMDQLNTISPLKQTPLLVHNIVRKSIFCAELSLKESDIVIEMDLCKNDPFVLAQSHQIEVILDNLIKNSKDEFLTNANIQASKKRQINLATSMQGGFFQIEFYDNCSSFEKGLLDKIFDPFFTTRDPGQGVGLGLTIVYYIVQSLKGQITSFVTEDGSLMHQIKLPVLA